MIWITNNEIEELEKSYLMGGNDPMGRMLSDILKYKKAVAILREANTHYAGEPFSTNDIYLDIFDLFEVVNSSVTEFDSDKFAQKAREAERQVKEILG